eukprot:gnl/MRDRNA2_/MRDRNA2_96209_c0_seq1.p1 gnl/MRDRNA2_/MRDRNA2_96209_c0~~gnl/MRDRNA2_/MRDRNA2_96209_c0_seq1.p1  ORF type:complete len:815 (-),score=167.94 gnl/MRDRNA2_/MRDRNA2_96209_c0_seq1:16-2460(-)
MQGTENHLHSYMEKFLAEVVAPFQSKIAELQSEIQEKERGMECLQKYLTNSIGKVALLENENQKKDEKLSKYGCEENMWNDINRKIDERLAELEIRERDLQDSLERKAKDQQLLNQNGMEKVVNDIANKVNHRIADLEQELQKFKAMAPAHHAENDCDIDMDVGKDNITLFCAPVVREKAGKRLGPYNWVQVCLAKDMLQKDTAVEEADCQDIQNVYWTQIVALLRDKRWGGQVEGLPGPISMFWPEDLVIWTAYLPDYEKKGVRDFEQEIVQGEKRVNVKVTKTLKFRVPDFLDNHILGDKRFVEKTPEGALDFRNLIGTSVHLIMRTGAEGERKVKSQFSGPEVRFEKGDELHFILEVQIEGSEAPFEIQDVTKVRAALEPLMSQKAFMARVNQCDPQGERTRILDVEQSGQPQNSSTSNMEQQVRHTPGTDGEEEEKKGRNDLPNSSSNTPTSAGHGLGSNNSIEDKLDDRGPDGHARDCQSTYPSTASPAKCPINLDNTIASGDCNEATGHSNPQGGSSYRESSGATGVHQKPSEPLTQGSPSWQPFGVPVGSPITYPFVYYPSMFHAEMYGSVFASNDLASGSQSQLNQSGINTSSQKSISDYDISMAIKHSPEVIAELRKNSDPPKPEMPLDSEGHDMTVCLQNLPLNMTRKQVMQALDQLGFWGQYNMIYVPCNEDLRNNVGFAFINLVDKRWAPWFRKRLEGYQLKPNAKKKICLVDPATVNGFDNMKKNFMESRKAWQHSKQAPCKRPIMWADENGDPKGRSACWRLLDGDPNIGDNYKGSVSQGQPLSQERVNKKKSKNKYKGR